MRRRRYGGGPRSSERSRRRWRALCGVLGGLGVLAGAIGLLAPRAGADTTPRPLAVGASVLLPAAGSFGGVIAVYGRATSEQPPPTAALGCTTTSGTVTQQGIEALDRLVVDGAAVVPVLRLTPGSDDAATLRCTGPAARALQPMFVVGRPGVEQLVPMASFSLASLFCVLGGAGLLLLRPATS